MLEILAAIAALALIIFAFIMFYKSDDTCDNDKEFAYKVKGILASVIAFILCVVLAFHDSDSSGSGSKDKDLYDYRSWDYDGDGNLDGKEMKDYQNFKSEMNKERNRRYN